MIIDNSSSDTEKAMWCASNFRDLYKMVFTSGSKVSDYRELKLAAYDRLKKKFPGFNKRYYNDLLVSGAKIYHAIML